MWLFLQDSSQAEAAAGRQNCIRETLQASTLCISWSMPEGPLQPSSSCTSNAHAGSYSTHCRAVSQASTSDFTLWHHRFSSCPASCAGNAAAADVDYSFIDSDDFIFTSCDDNDDSNNNLFLVA